MNNGGRNELRPYGAGEIIRCAPTSSYGTFPGFVGAPFMAPTIHTQVSVWIYTVEIGAGCPMKDGGRNELRPYGAGETIRCATTSSYGTFLGFVGAPFMAPTIHTQVSA
ncbi:hypothetical protein AB840_01825 [Megasphaera cerevisiae DSM 20462]|uniref:Uncharacterized protein n=1 Tax=Megasphaera cerevisiae DSM 20462 TaxID=1122219 RepID=A0A0J6ZRS4_9FIRM|nr:hypothetical protein [Megasphaera cerevisiae]KMO87656.1 hypothetical protein AB840_01825 [Megasphaera cerevisiae DSM 20462]SKA23443.1 hypothetical protein SAMN05660900_02946 [Megasphaera cerevisiae DSM 20462]